MASTAFKIMIIDDNVTMAEMTRDFLDQRLADSEIKIFGSGEQALVQTEFLPDAIILDYHLDTLNPGALNGMQAFLQLKKKFAAPVIVLSAQESPSVSANLIKAGAFDYVVKDMQAFNRIENILSAIRTIGNRKPAPARYPTVLITGLIIIILILLIYIVSLKTQ